MLCRLFSTVIFKPIKKQCKPIGKHRLNLYSIERKEKSVVDKLILFVVPAVKLTNFLADSL